MTSFDEMVKTVSPDIYERFKRAIELRRWPNGTPLAREQLEICIQAVISYEHQHMEPSLRTGYVPPKHNACKKEDLPAAERAVKWQR